MKKMMAVVCAALLCCTFSITDGFSQEKQDAPYIEVAGSAEMEILPDEILLDVVVKERDLKGGMKLADMEKVIGRVLESQGVDAKEALSINDVDAVLRKRVLRADEVNEVRYYTIKLSSATQFVSVIDALRKEGITEMTLNKISLSQKKKDECRLEILAQAAKRAKEEAGTIAAALDVKLGRPLVIRNSYVNFNSGVSMVRVSNKAMMSDMMAAGDEYMPEQTSLDFSKLTVSGNVSVKYEIVEK